MSFELDRKPMTNGKAHMSGGAIYYHAWKVPQKKTVEGHGIVRIDAIGRSRR